MHHHTERSFIEEFRWVSSLHYLKNGWRNAVLWCMFQVGPPSLHYYCTTMLHSCIVLPPVGHSSNHEYHCCQLTRQSSCVSNFYRTFKFSFDCPSFVTWQLCDLYALVSFYLKLCLYMSCRNCRELSLASLILNLGTGWS